jgi:tellurium resistance protein TerD
MAVSLNKGGNVNLSKEVPGLSAVHVGLGWDARVTDGKGFDLDASVFALGADGCVRSDADFIFYNNLKSSDGSIVHQGDNRTGQGEGDDEAVKIKLSSVPADISRIVFAVTIHEGEANGQNFGQVQNASIRVANDAGGAEIARYDLSEDSAVETAMVFGEVYRNGDDWKFKAVGQGFKGGLAPLARSFGVNIG